MTRRFTACKALIALSVVTAGCATPPASAPAQKDPARVALETAIARKADLPEHAAAADIPAKPAVLAAGTVTIRSYVGEASSLLGRVARARGMAFKVTGPEPRLPLLVTVDVDGVTFEEFLGLVGHQFGQRAHLVLGDSRIEIRYRGMN